MQVRAIKGKDLIFYTKKGETDFNKKYLNQIDPEGWSIITMEFLHNDGPDWRLVLLFKMKDTMQPVDGTLTITDYARKMMVHTITMDTETH